MNHELLTPDRIEAAREHLNHGQLVYIGHGKEFTDRVENCETALAALDLARDRRCMGGGKR